MLLEFSQYLENYLWKNYKAGQVAIKISNFNNRDVDFYKLKRMRVIYISPNIPIQQN